MSQVYILMMRLIYYHWCDEAAYTEGEERGGGERREGEVTRRWQRDVRIMTQIIWATNMRTARVETHSCQRHDS